MALINCEISLILKFAITDTKFHVPVVTLTEDNLKLLKQLESGFSN